LRRSITRISPPSTASRKARGFAALVLELVEGPTLADRIAGEPIPLDEALSIARQIAQALDAAHERGIVHRDLKPANIVLTVEGVARVLDFGLAKIASSGAGPAAVNDPTLWSAKTRWHRKGFALFWRSKSRPSGRVRMQRICSGQIPPGVAPQGNPTKS